MKLFERGNMGKFKLKNRIVMAAMGMEDLVQADGG